MNDYQRENIHRAVRALPKNFRKSLDGLDVIDQASRESNNPVLRGIATTIDSYAGDSTGVFKEQFGGFGIICEEQEFSRALVQKRQFYGAKMQGNSLAGAKFLDKSLAYAQLSGSAARLAVATERAGYASCLLDRSFAIGNAKGRAMERVLVAGNRREMLFADKAGQGGYFANQPNVEFKGDAGRGSFFIPQDLIQSYVDERDLGKLYLGKEGRKDSDCRDEKRFTNGKHPVHNAFRSFLKKTRRSPPKDPEAVGQSLDVFSSKLSDICEHSQIPPLDEALKAFSGVANACQGSCDESDVIIEGRVTAFEHALLSKHYAYAKILGY